MVMKTKSLALLILFFIFSNCKAFDPLTLQKTSPFILSQTPYYQAWISGMPGGGSGINVFIPIEEAMNFRLDSLHFRGQRVKAVYQNKSIFACYETIHNQNRDIILTKDVLEEMDNSLLSTVDRSPFSLKDNACILSYQVNNKRCYYKIEDLQQKPTIGYPSAPTD